MTTHSHETAPRRFEPTAKRTALVAGASGLAGGYMLAHLLEQGDWNVVAISRRNPTKQQRRRSCSPEKLRSSPAPHAA